jgi:hypothetical protein
MNLPARSTIARGITARIRCGVSRSPARFLLLLPAVLPARALTVTNRPPEPASGAPTRQLFLHDIRDPVTIQTLGAWLVRILAVLILGALLWWAWNRWRRSRPTPAAPPPPPPDARALRRLTEALQWIGQPERFCTSVSEILRTYLEERFGLRAPERTTEEFLSELRNSISLDLKNKQVLGDFLTRCDLVKFARAEPGPAELQELHAAAVRLVEETAHRVPAPPVLSEPPVQPPLQPLPSAPKPEDPRP